MRGLPVQSDAAAAHSGARPLHIVQREKRVAGRHPSVGAVVPEGVNGGAVQVKYTNQSPRTNQAGAGKVTFEPEGGALRSDARSFFFRIGSSAIRAFGGCLGSKRR